MPANKRVSKNIYLYLIDVFFGSIKMYFLGRRQLVFQLSGFPTFLISESHLGQKTGWVPLVPLRFVGSSNIWNIWIPPFPVLLVRRWYIAQGYTGWGFQQTIRAFPHILSCGIYLSIYRYTQYLFIYLGIHNTCSSLSSDIIVCWNLSKEKTIAYCYCYHCYYCYCLLFTIVIITIAHPISKKIAI